MIGLVALAATALAAAPLSLTLDEALAEAARVNLDLELSRTQASLAGVDVYGSYAGVLPRLDLTAGFGHDFVGPRNLVTAFPTGVDPASGQPVFEQRVVAIPATDNPDYSLALALQLTLFDGARSWNGIARARAAARGADRSYDEAALTVAFEVTRRFYEVLKAHESVRVLQEAVARSEEVVRRTEALFEAGRGSRADALTAQGNLGRDRISVEQARARLVQAEADLALVLGRDAGSRLEVVAPAPALGPVQPAWEEPPGGDVLLERARRARPLLAAQAESVRAAELDQSIARGAWSPVVGVQGNYTRTGPTLAGREGVYGDPSRQYVATAQLVVQWNVFEGRQTLAGEQRAALALRRARAQARQAEQQVSNEIARARSAAVATHRAAVLAAGNLVAAEQGVALARDRLAAGAANQLELRDASLKLTQAELDLLDARVDHVVALADLNRAVGGVL